MGLELFLYWANDEAIRPVMGLPITREAIAFVDSLRLTRIASAIQYSNRFVAGIRETSEGKKNVDAIVVDAVGNGLPTSNCYGALNIGRCIFERTDLSRARDALSKYDALLTASHWNAGLIERATGRVAKVIFEGVDTSLFCPAPKSGVMDPAKFYVFSGGKIELRKAQDLVLVAFKRFAASREDCMLVTAWHSPWPQYSAGFKGKLPVAIEMGPNGMLDVGKWVAQNGIDTDCVIDIGLVPNVALPMILREMDVALQPSRAEACTTLPVKEAMACGIPVIAAANTGMKDLLTDDNCILLGKQSAVQATDASMEGWGESDVDEMVAALEFAYDNRERARQIGLRSRDWLIEHGRTWQAHASAVKDWIMSL